MENLVVLQDYDFVLRCVEHAECVKHVPKVLYHWRAHKDSTAKIRKVNYMHLRQVQEQCRRTMTEWEFRRM